MIAPFRGPDYHPISWRRGTERMVGFGKTGPALLFLAPFFEEANRTRHFIIETMRGLAARGFRCFLPDMPGTLESQIPLSGVTWADWQALVHDAISIIDSPVHSVAIRGGALLDCGIVAQSRYRLAPVDGAAIIRDLVRIRMASEREDGLVVTAAEIEQAAMHNIFEVAGYRIAPDFMAALKLQTIDNSPPARTARLATDAQNACIKIAGQPLWRRSEPGHDVRFSQLVVNDIAKYVAQCEAG